jgi:enamine deaminase RidA (YjgF/YER057c/UK114 family)
VGHDDDPAAAGLGAPQRIRQRHRRSQRHDGLHRRADRADRRRPLAGERFRRALANILEVLAQAGGEPEHRVRLTRYVLDKQEYLRSLKEVGAAYRELMGRNYPAMTVVQVGALIEDEARLEIEATVVIPD